MHNYSWMRQIETAQNTKETIRGFRIGQASVYDREAEDASKRGDLVSSRRWKDEADLIRDELEAEK